MKKTTVFLLVLTMILITVVGCDTKTASTNDPTQSTTTAFTSEANKSPYPEYLNMDGYKPIVKEGNDVTLSVISYLKESPSSGDPDKSWMKAYIEKKFNIKLNIEGTLDPTEKKSILFASQDLPDIFLGMELSTLEQLKYGQVEGQLMSLNNLINDYMPALKTIMEEKTSVPPIITCPNGNIYTLPRIGDIDTYPWGSRMFVKKTWLDALNMDLPDTLDEFYDMLVAFKKQDPAGVGSENVIPLGGGADADKPLEFIQIALGYMQEWYKESRPALRNGEVDILCGNKEIFKYYLTFMNKLYTEGLIDKDFYTIDSTEARGLFAENKIGVYAYPPYVITPDTYKDWVGLGPLKSEYNDNKAWPLAFADNSGTAAISSTCAYPEVAARLLDYFYTQEGQTFAWQGPSDKDTDILFDMVKGWTIDENNTIIVPEVKDGIYESAYAYGFAAITFFSNLVPGDQRDNTNKIRSHYGLKPIKSVYDLTNGDDHYRAMLTEACNNYLTAAFPRRFIFFNEKESERMNELNTVIQEFVAGETAQFITGEKSIETELDAYFKELESLGFSEYLKLWKSGYEVYKVAMGE